MCAYCAVSLAICVPSGGPSAGFTSHLRTGPANMHDIALILTGSLQILRPSPGIEDLREKREEVNRSIAKDEEEKGVASGRLRIARTQMSLAALGIAVATHLLPFRCTAHSQDPERLADPDRAAGAHQRQSGP